MLKFDQKTILLCCCSILCLTTPISAFQNNNPKWNLSRVKQQQQSTMMIQSSENNDDENNNDRRSFMNSLLKTSVKVTAAGVAFTNIMTMQPNIANAGIDPSMLKNYQVQGDESGQATRLRQIENVQRPASDLTNMPFEELPSGVSYREYREGKGAAVIQPGSKVAAEVSIRCKSFSTQKEPGGLKYFSTAADTEFNEIAWTIGSGELPPGLEEAMMGMHRNSLRRIELPSTQVFAARNDNQLPQPTTKDGKRIFERLFKTEATLLFEVLVTRIK